MAASDRPDARDPLVLHVSAEGVASSARVVACSAAAARHGVEPGQPLAEAQALCPQARFEVHDPRADRTALEQLAEWCQRFTPFAAVEDADYPECLLLDITGCGPVFGGEEKLVARLLHELREQGYAGRAAVADSLGGAWAVVHFGIARPAASAIVPPGGLRASLRPLPIEALRLPADVAELLRRFDLGQVGQLLDLPRAVLPARFGPIVGQRLDQALGTLAEPLTPVRWAEPFEADWTFDPPCGQRRQLEAVLEHLLERLVGQLRQRAVGAQRLLCRLDLATREEVSIEVGLLRPSQHAERLSQLLRLRCEQLQLPAEVTRATLRALVVRSLESVQGDYFPTGTEPPALDELLERLSNRLGEQAVLRALPGPDAQPERACRFESWLLDRAAVPPTRNNRRLRPLRLKRKPAAVAMLSLVPGGSPARFAWRQQSYQVAQAWGPERIETGWWRGPAIRRDYYLVETTTGQRFWLFRARRKGRWFLQGEYG